nr:MAG TPA: hypothetical protein [Crassvirales sp.]
MIVLLVQLSYHVELTLLKQLLIVAKTLTIPVIYMIMVNHILLM